MVKWYIKIIDNNTLGVPWKLQQTVCIFLTYEVLDIVAVNVAFILVVSQFFGPLQLIA